MSSPASNRIAGPGFASSRDSAESRDGRRFPGGAFGASVLWHGVLIGLVALTWVEKEAVKIPSPGSFEVLPDTGRGEMAASAANPGENESAPARHETSTRPGRLFVAPPSVRNWTPPVPRDVADEAAPANDWVRPARAEVSAPPHPTSNRTTYGEHIRQNGQPASRSAPSATPRSNAGSGGAGPRVVVARPGPGAGDGGGRSALGMAAVGGEMDRYFAGLVRQLGQGHVKPAGLSDLLNAEVSFTVAADGRISELRIVRSSGNADFDRSVREAFARVTLAGRPDGKTDVRTLTFRMQES